jgi:acetylornithine deacetylase/succinyl-diaminopimelate desuccinylase-like protein
MLNERNPVFSKSVRRTALSAAVVCMLAATGTPAQSPPPALDPEIQSIVGAVDVTRIETSIQRLVAFGTRNTCSSTSSTTRGIGAARNWINAQFTAIAGLQVRNDPFTLRCSGATRTRHNVIAWLPGVGNPNRIIVIGGHYDSRTTSGTDITSDAPGANDSGSQAAALIELARVMAQRPHSATIVFAAFAGEEQGLLGSAAFATNYRTYFPSGTIETALVMDIVGGDNTANNASELQQFRIYSPGTPREVNQTGEGSTDDTSPSRGVMRQIGYWGAGYVPSMTMVPRLREDRPSRGSDHKSFIARSIPGVRFIELNENLAHQHSPNDLYQFVTPAYTARIVQVMAGVGANLARASAPPRTPTVSLASSNSVNVSWTAPASGPAPQRYVIAARPVTSNFYQSRFSVTAPASSATVRIVEDLNIPAGTAFYVSVAAVDAFGHESLFAYPEYRCTSSGCAVPAGSLDVTTVN